jgi:hypothetical protein
MDTQKIVYLSKGLATGMMIIVTLISMDIFVRYPEHIVDVSA